MDSDTITLILQQPLLQAYLITACLMLLKLMLQPWMTVARMMKVSGGYRSPEDMKKSPLNPNPNPAQTELNEYVDRSRRINLNDLENIPGFLFAGLLFIAVEPPLLLAQILLWTFVVARFAHFVAYLTAQLHDVRATFWTVGSISVIAMTGYTLWQVLTGL